MSIPVVAHSLPSISPLPPIEMPDSSSPPPSPRHTPDHNNRFSFLGPSSTSLLSQNSFTTALSSSPVEQSRTASPMYLPPPQSLRKSISVDSLVRQDVPKASTRSKRTNTDLSMPVPVIQHSRSRDFNYRHTITRSRGVSISSDYDPSVAEDSDSELWPSSRRRSSLKGKEQQQPFIPPGELKLPPRMPALSLASSISSISTAPSSPREDCRRLHSTTSLQSIPGRMANPTLANISGRTRSGSLGVKVAGGRSTLINTQLPPKSFSESVDPITIAVVGALGVGKSTVTHKGAKQFGLSDSTVHSAPPGMLGVQTSLRYVRRIGLVTEIEILGEMTPSCPLHLLEIDIAHLGWEQTTTFPNEDSSAGAPQIDGVLICYDATAPSSFTHVEELLKRLQMLKLPFMVLVCKSDLERQVDPKLVHELLQRYDSGLVEASKESELGKDKMRRSFQWLIMAILRERRCNGQDPDYRNPASPVNLGSLPPWENPRSSIDSSTSSSMTSTRTVAHSQAQVTSSRLQQASTMPSIPSSRSPSVPTSPTRARSTSDLLSEHEKSRNQGRPFDSNTSSRNSMLNVGIGGSVSSDQLHMPPAVAGEASREEIRSAEPEPKQSRPAQWATLDELLDKLLFLAVSGDDSTFISNFLLTYRRFASPRKVLLAMQKRIRQLDSPSGDPMFACYAQMRICHLLEQWIQDYPYDFGVGHTPAALNALVSSIVAKTYLLHYGCDFAPFAETLGSLKDKDAAWALPLEDMEGSDDSYSVFDDEEELPIVNGIHDLVADEPESPPSIVVSSRERRLSLPLTVTTSGQRDAGPNTVSFSIDDAEYKKFLKDLVKNSQEISLVDATHIAEEITRIEAQYFLEIEPRHWLHYTLVSGRKDPEFNTIARFNTFSNHLADWVVSLILCHDRPKNRARQIEKFAEVAHKLRGLSNYSALRAFVAGINNSTFPGDATMELFKAKCPDLYKMFQSWDILLQASRSHRAYRMALKSSKGACIPALEVHMSDLIRAHEGNADSHPDHPNKIHWGKFNMIGKFVNSTTQCQVQCRNAPEYTFSERPYISKLMEHPVMDSEMQRSRIAPPEESSDDIYRNHVPRTYSRDTPGSSQTKDASNLVRKLFSW